MIRPLTHRRPLVAVRRLLVARAVACCAAASGAVAVVGACGGRQVVVGTGGEAGATTTSVQFTNNLPQTVNVYLRGPDGGEVFLRQVPARTTEAVPVRGVRAGTSVQLRVAPVNGAANILRDNVVVGSGTAVQVP
jgi:hypothetical protein